MWRTTGYLQINTLVKGISIHVLRVEDDAACIPSSTNFFPFQSTSSVWRTTALTLLGDADQYISIHVLRVEDDLATWLLAMWASYFNPRPPCGGRHSHLKFDVVPLHFNPRPPCGGRPRKEGYRQLCLVISIHVLRVEDDCSKSETCLQVTNFNPRPPCGGRPSTKS